MDTVEIHTDDGRFVLCCDRTDRREPPQLSLDEPGDTFGLSFRTERCTDPVPGVRVEILRSGLFGDLFPAGAALLPDDGGETVWLSSPERSDAGRILLGAVEALRGVEVPVVEVRGAEQRGAELRGVELPAQVTAPAVPAPRARVQRIAGWDEVDSPNGLPGGLPEGERPTDVQRAQGGAWSIVLDTAPDLPLEARLWLQHREQSSEGEVVRLTATWHGPGRDVPWHVELHVCHRVGAADEAAVTDFLVLDGSTEEGWVLADAVCTAGATGATLTWRVHPAPRPDEASRTGEALYALITALAQACPV